MHFAKKRKLFILISYLILFLCFIGIIMYSYYAMKKSSAINTPGKTLNLLTWKHIPTAVLDGFQEEYPDYSVNVQRYSKGNYLSFLKTKLSSDSSVDLIELPSESYAEFVSSDSLLPITNEPFLYRFTDESIQFLNSLTDSQDIYGIPYQSDYLYVWYNKALFRKYNISVPDTSKNLLKACEKLSKEGIPPLSIGLSEPDIAQMFLSAMTAQSAMNPDLQPSYKDTIDTLYNFSSLGYIDFASYSMNEEQAFQAFLNNDYAMAFTTESASSLLNDSILQKIDIDLTGLYVTLPNTQKLAIGSPANSIIGIYKNSPSGEAALQFLEYYTQYDTVTTFSEETRCTTNIQNYTISNELSASIDLIKTSDTYVYWNNSYFSPFSADFDDRTLAQKLFFGMIPPEEYITKVQQGE